MLRDGRLGDAQQRDEVADGTLAGEQLVEDPPACRLGQDGERVHEHRIYL